MADTQFPRLSPMANRGSRDAVYGLKGQTARPECINPEPTRIRVIHSDSDDIVELNFRATS